jgi:hypothetical protein
MTAPQLRLVHEGVTLARQPPWIALICETPETKTATRPCGYEAATCNGAAQACPQCGYSYCLYHYGRHQSTLTLPRDSFKSYRRWLWSQLDARVQGRKRGPKPSYEWEHEDD